MFGNTFARNMVSDEKGLPADWDVKTGRNVKWWADVGSQAYAGPVGRGRQGLRGHEQRRPPQPGSAQRPRRGDGLRRGDGRLPLADDPREAHRRPGERLAAAGRLLDTLRRGQPSLLHLQPGHPRLPRHRGLEGRQRRAGRRREGEGPGRRRRGVGVRHDDGAGRLPAQPGGAAPRWWWTGSSTPPPATASTRATSTSRSPTRRASSPSTPTPASWSGRATCPARRSSTARGRTPPTAWSRAGPR